MFKKLLILILCIFSYVLGAFVECHEDFYKNNLNSRKNECTVCYQKKLEEIHQKAEVTNEKIAEAEAQLRRFKNLVNGTGNSETTTTEN